MKKIFLSLLVMIAINQSFAQFHSGTLKVREASFLKGERSVSIELTNLERKTPLTCENVTGGPYYYFLLTPTDDWTWDQEFVKEILQKISLNQDGKKLRATWYEPLPKDKETPFFLVGFDKTFKLNKEFNISMTFDKSSSTVTFKIAMHLWPGYSDFMRLTKDIETTVGNKKYREAIWQYEGLISSTQYEIFPTFASLPEKRTKAFELYHQTKVDAFNIALTLSVPLKEKISNIEGMKPDFQYVIDSLPRPDLKITLEDPKVNEVIALSQRSIKTLLDTRDSLKRVLDDQNTRWIIEGTATGKMAAQYRVMVQVLAYAFLSIDFTDTSAAVTMDIKLTDELQTLLTKNNLTESYETFIRLSRIRAENKISIIPIPMITNLSKDTAAFPLPYYWMLKAFNDFYNKNWRECRRVIQTALKTSYDTGLNERLDLIRTTIIMREEGYPEEAMRLSKEAEKLEASGQVENALEKFRQAVTLGRDFAYFKYVLGRHYARTGEPNRALVFFQQAYTSDTLYLSAYREAVNLYRRNATFKPMIEVLTLALQYGNDNWEINYSLGTAYMGDGDPARAIQNFEKAAGWNPQSYETFVQLGLAYQSIKDYSKARDYFYRAINLNPDRQAAVDYLKQLNELQRTNR